MTDIEYTPTRSLKKDLNNATQAELNGQYQDRNAEVHQIKRMK